MIVDEFECESVILAIACLCCTLVSVCVVLLINSYQYLVLGLGYHVQSIQTVSSL